MINKLNQVIYLTKFAIRSRFAKKYRTPLLCSFKITGICNLRCAHCPFWRDRVKNSSNSSVSLDFENVVQMLDKLYSEGVRIVIFEGGEPLLWKDDKNAKDINDVIKYAKRFFFFTGVTTNGTIDIEGLNPDIFFISIDGLKSTHDRLRGSSFDVIMRNIEKNGPNKKIVANICISSENIGEIEELVKFLGKKVYGTTIQFFYPYSGLADLKPGNKEKEQLLKNLIDLKKKGVNLLNSISCMKMMINNSWKCDDFLVASIEHNGLMSRGCYLKNKTPEALCADCGFTVHCEISLAYRFNIDALRSAAGIFWG